MKYKRLGIGGIVAAGLVAAACGSAVGNSGDSGLDTARGDPIETPEELLATPSGSTFRPPTESAANTENPGLTPFGRASYLPQDASETPDGRQIFRTEQSPSGFGLGWTTDFNIRTIDLTEIISGGPPRDGIPPIDDPKFVAIGDVAGIYADNAPVIQLEVNGDVRAYPIGILTWHEIVNDVVGGVPVSVTFCPLCNSAIAFERTIDGKVFDFGTSGTLRKSDLVMWDRQTESLWQQIGGEAIVGSMVGARLNLLPAPIVSWAQFKENFPNALVLSQETGFIRSYGTNPYSGYDDVNNTPFLFRGKLNSTLSPFERVVTLDLGDEFVAYPFPLLEEVRIFQDVRKQQDIAVFWTPGASSALDARDIDDGREVGSTGVFVRTVDGESLDFAPNPADDQTFLDEQTGTTWNIFGKAVAGPMIGTQLEPLVFANHFWFAWAAFQPDTEVVIG